MSSRTLLNLLLLAGLGALVVLTVYEPGIEKPTTTRLTTLDARDITTLTLKRPDKVDIVLRREAGGWQMEQPYQAPATPFLDQNLSDLLSATASADYPLTELDQELVGLSPAVATLDLGKVTLRFGDLEPVHGNRYVQAGDRVYLIPDHLAVYTSVEAIELLSPALLPQGSHITGIDLPALPVANAKGNSTDRKIPARTLRLVGGLWTLREHANPTRQPGSGTNAEPLTEPVTEPDQGPSADDLTRWLDEWRYAQAIDIKPLATGKGAKTDSTTNSIELTMNDREPVRLLIVTTAPDLILARPDTGLAYRFSAEQAQRLLYPPNTGIDAHKTPER